ncbi:MAG: hypothetical protein KDI47_01465 [Gammaproteobacteria bacterium]|nr:hypothetical protein [Gammaproteobacteria bacterium]
MAGRKKMIPDFSHLNLDYLIQARDLALEDRHRTGVILGVPNEWVCMLRELTPEMLASVTPIKLPLVIPCRDNRWWSRLFIALRDGETQEIGVVFDQAALEKVSQ